MHPRSIHLAAQHLQSFNTRFQCCHAFQAGNRVLTGLEQKKACAEPWNYDPRREERELGGIHQNV